MCIHSNFCHLCSEITPPPFHSGAFSRKMLKWVSANATGNNKNVDCMLNRVSVVDSMDLSLHVNTVMSRNARLCNAPVYHSQLTGAYILSDSSNTASKEQSKKSLLLVLLRFILVSDTHQVRPIHFCFRGLFMQTAQPFSTRVLRTQIFLPIHGLLASPTTT